MAGCGLGMARGMARLQVVTRAVRPLSVLARGEEALGAVRWQIDDCAVMTITLSNGQKRNPLTHEVLSALSLLLRSAAGKDLENVVRVVLLESEGPVFSSGHDFADFLEERGPAAHAETLALCSSVNVALQQIPQPTIAVVQGLATAGGCQLACSCDLVVASAAAAFQLPGAKAGGFCHTPAVSVGARATSPRFALELALLSEAVPAERAERMGLVNRVVPGEQLQAEARRMAEQIARVVPAAQMQLGKRLFYEQQRLPTLEEKYAAAEPAMLEMFAGPVWQQFMRGFFAKRAGKK